MSENVRVTQSDGSRFMVVLREDKTDRELFFGGWFCEVDCPGDEENETLCWEQESWVDRPEDGAVMFRTYREAADCANELNMDNMGPDRELVVVLFGKHAVFENATHGSRWYPLKEFHGTEEKRW